MKLQPRVLCVLVLALLAAIAISAREAQDSASIPYHPSVATVGFECMWEAATPQDYVISVKALGSATYLSRNPSRAASPDDDPDYHLEFTLSAATQARIFKLTEQANYFSGDFDYKKHQVAQTGTKTLTYADPRRHFATSYNWSENSAIDQLTRLFEGISSTVEHGRKLQFLRRFDKLGLEAELKGMEDAAQHGYLAELQIIAPTLKNLADDPAVLNIARQRARRLLDLSDKESRVSAGVKTSQ